jgi:hypothetical protein
MVPSGPDSTVLDATNRKQLGDGLFPKVGQP